MYGRESSTTSSEPAVFVAIVYISLINILYPLGVYSLSCFFFGIFRCYFRVMNGLSCAKVVVVAVHVVDVVASLFSFDVDGGG